MILFITCSLVFHLTSSPSKPTSKYPSLIPSIYQDMKTLPLSYPTTNLSQAVLLHPLDHYRAIPFKHSPQPSVTILVSWRVLGGVQWCLAENTALGPREWNRSVTGWGEKYGYDRESWTLVRGRTGGGSRTYWKLKI